MSKPANMSSRAGEQFQLVQTKASDFNEGNVLYSITVNLYVDVSQINKERFMFQVFKI